jgi:Na+-transporting NADH:ubiquinone oxidoreductase subunit NqrC
MELIPILSTIILVATISTFILAIGAYILFKIHERQADQHASRHLAIERAELLEPANIGKDDVTKETEIVVERQIHPVETNAKREDANRKLKKDVKSTIKRKPLGTKYTKINSKGKLNDLDAEDIRWK